MIIVFFGPPGSGKGTQAKELENTEQGILHVSTGDLLRQEISTGSELGRKLQTQIEAGEFVTDDIILTLVSETLGKNFQEHCTKLLLLIGFLV